MTATVAPPRATPPRSHPRPLLGSAAPRVETVRPPGTSRGLAVARWAHDVLGVDLLPWQRHALRAGLVWRDDDGETGPRWASRTVGILVARQNGKTRLVTVRALAGMVLLGERDVVAAAQNRDIALEAWRDALDLATDAGLDVHHVCRTNGREEFSIGRARYKISSATRRGPRGLSADLVIADEVREYRDWEAWAALEKTRRARRSSQLWAISNEGDEGSVVLAMLAGQGRTAAQTGEVGDLAWMEWSAAPDLPRDDPRGWAQANPAMGHLITRETVASEARHDEPELFETEVLCRRVATIRPWLEAGLWEAVGDPLATHDGDGVCFALDSGPERRHATIALAGRRPDGRIHVEAVAGYLAQDGEVLPRAANRLAELCARWAPVAVYVVDRTEAREAAVRALEGTGTPVVAVNFADLERAAHAFHEAVVARTLIHPVDPMTTGHVAAVTQGGVMRRRSPSADVDAAIAVVLAHRGLASAPAPAPVQDWEAY